MKTSSGWPETFVPPSAEIQGTGNVAEKAHDLIKTGPNPADVMKFHKGSKAIVTETAARFGLSRVQVIKVCGPGQAA